MPIISSGTSQPCGVRVSAIILSVVQVKKGEILLTFAKWV
jgi:hypothetical protein